ncbi:MAG: phosphotransferase [Gemmatimonadetes bacterium]|nr:phosphotransferase [Gemmatimonadota bacterium]
MKEVKWALEAWDVSVQCIRANAVPEVYHVESTTGERFVLKDVGASDVLVRTETQFRVTRHVHDSGLPIAYLVETRSGSFYSRIDSSIYILMPFLPDDEPDFYGPDSGPLYRAIGAAYGRLHAILADFEGPIETWVDNAYDPLFKDYVPEALPKLSGEARRRVEDTLSEVEGHLRLIASSLPMEPVFQDVHRGNVRMVKGEFRGFIDCDHISIGQRIDDITTALISMIKYEGRNGLPSEGETGEHRRWWLAHFSEFLASYNAVNPLRPLERDHMPYVMLSRCLPELEEIERGNTCLQLLDWFQANRTDIEVRFKEAVGE